MHLMRQGHDDLENTEESKQANIASGQTLHHTGEVPSNELWKAALWANLLENNKHSNFD